jgi:hypothetical protein
MRQIDIGRELAVSPRVLAAELGCSCQTAGGRNVRSSASPAREQSFRLREGFRTPTAKSRRVTRARRPEDSEERTRWGVCKPCMAMGI